ncbi:MAG TPA: cbb3-type cytochrome c oxidase subunit 3 [Verrucomicrobiae bacterium]
MIQDVLHHIGGVANYGILSLFLFFAVFAGVLIWALRLKRADLDSAAALPLKDDETIPITSEHRYD